MINVDDYTNENKTQRNKNWPYIRDHPYRIFIIIHNQPDIDKIYLHVKDPDEAKYQLLINTGERTGLKHFNNHKAFIEYSNHMRDVY